MLEITENMVMADIDSARTVMKKLKSLGVKLAIDDFGTGQSSLGYLKQFPVDEVKVLAAKQAARTRGRASLVAGRTRAVVVEYKRPRIGHGPVSFARNR